MDDTKDPNGNKREQQSCKRDLIQQSWFRGRRSLGCADYATLRYSNRAALGHCSPDDVLAERP